MVALKGIPKVLSPELLFALARMGHGDEIVLADANFPTSSICQCGPVEIRADGLDIPQILEAVLKLLPLDTYVESPAAVMELVPSDKERGLQTPIWNHYESLLLKADCKRFAELSSHPAGTLSITGSGRDVKDAPVPGTLRPQHQENQRNGASKIIAAAS
ncbi:Protein fucU-like [Cricetulus griseus]|uniref:L-fucose mutarotase n=1 Tax=Cricetulus griseus TaxID=10029 RepID=G3IAN6_CRIGR|nr:Protein fucU-like [Cricetulus griseus]ERE77999.1 fucose mutarotase-like protein [Cricetulus griseus]